LQKYTYYCSTCETDVYFKILDSTRADIPDDMQKSWLDKKDQLGLTGKFLPDESALRAYL
jgi:hypothetical protein